MNYTALSALEEQAELVREYGSFSKGEPSSIIGHFPKQTAEFISEMVGSASPCFVSKEIQGMLEHAMPTLPDTIPLTIQDVPFPYGFVKLATPIRQKALASPLPDSWDVITHFSWYRNENLVGIFWYGKSIRDGESNGLLQYMTASTWLYGQPLDDDTLVSEFFDKFEGRQVSMRTTYGRGDKSMITEVEPHTLAAATYLAQLELLRWAYSVWHFMVQKVAAKERHYPNRAMRRKLNLEKTEKFVDIITLRASEKRKEQEFEEASRHVSVRFWVRGHWRKQWYPSEGVNKPVWISSYVKGPEGAKFVGATKLFSVSR